MAAEDIGNLVPTKIPGYVDDADIQAALKLYHYGDYDFDINETNPNNLIEPSMAFTINDLQNQIDAQVTLEEAARDISRATDDEPVAGDFSSFSANIPNGYIWVDTNAAAGVGLFGATAVYTTVAPTVNLQNGIIWIEKGSSPLKMYVYNSDTSNWDEIGA